MTTDNETLKGGCMCGAVRYSLPGPPTYVGHCHCRDCQRAIGAGVVTWVGSKPQVFNITKGSITYCETSAGVFRGFCGRCGSSLTFHGEGWDEIGITAASLDEPGSVKPASNVFLSHRQPWIIPDMSLRNYDEFP